MVIGEIGLLMNEMGDVGGVQGIGAHGVLRGLELAT